jgi:hypothetical protein
MIETREQYEDLMSGFIGGSVEKTIEALRDVARPTKKFGEYDTPSLLTVIADDYDNYNVGSIVIQERARWLRDLAAKFEKANIPAWLTEVNND